MVDTNEIAAIGKIASNVLSPDQVSRNVSRIPGAVKPFGRLAQSSEPGIGAILPSLFG